MKPAVGIIMGSASDWDTMKKACLILTELEIAYEKRVISAHRTPDRAFDYAQKAKKRGLKVIIAGAGGAAHLAGVLAAQTTLPVIGVPIQTEFLSGLDSLLSTVQMPAGVPVGTMAVGAAGAANAAWYAAQILAAADPDLATRIEKKRTLMAEAVEASNSKLV